MRTILVWGLTALLLLAVSCDASIDPPPGSLGGACYGEAEGCATGLACENGTCKDLCADVTCPAGKECSTATGSCMTVNVPTPGPDVQEPPVEDVTEMPDLMEPEDSEAMTDMGEPEPDVVADEDTVTPNVDTSK